VRINGLLHVADWFKHRDTEPPSTRQLVEFLFDCEVPADYRPRNGHHPDKHQVEVQWRELRELPGIRLLPQSLAEHLAEHPRGNGKIYLGNLE
jgi:8-oxo-dGTP diphosphatase